MILALSTTVFTVDGHEFKGGAADLLVEPNVGLGRVPALERVGFVSLFQNDAHCHLRSPAGVRPVIRYRRDRVTAEPASSLVSKSRKPPEPRHRTTPCCTVSPNYKYLETM